MKIWFGSSNIKEDHLHDGGRDNCKCKLGQGSVFRVWIPIKRSLSMDKAILIIEDNTDNQYLMQYLWKNMVIGCLGKRWQNRN
jgi:hypothetical protein